MSILEFILTFLALIAISSGACIGLYICTRGQWEITPDGKWKKTGMIFKNWSLFWEQYRKTKTVYYAGEGLKQKFDLLNKVHPDIASRLLLRENDLKFNGIINTKEHPLIEDCLLCKVELWNGGGEGMRFMLTTEVPVYDWPEWVQKPISSCPTCYAGPYGTAIWLVFLKLQRDAFAWTDYPLFGKIAFAIIFLLSLSACNNWLSFKLKL